MVSDYLFPALVVILKFVYKLALGRTVSGVDFFRAFLNFPIDLAFLALSFAAIVLSYFQAYWIIPLSLKDSLTVFVAYVMLSALVTFFVRNSETNFDIDQNVKCIAWMIPAYLIAISLVTFIIFAGKT